MNNFKILIVDDEPKICNLLKEILDAEGYETDTALNGADALEKIEDGEIDLVLLDIKLPDIDGIALLKKIKKHSSDISVIMISAFGTVQLAVEALKNGAEDFLEKPLETTRVLITIKNVLEKCILRKERNLFKNELLRGYEIIGKSEGIKRVMELIKRIGPTNSEVLILGETGTGKELVARNLHIISERTGAPFVKVNCAALPGELIESELFGYEKGAFTGAFKRKPGQFELAHKGTLFLDEIGDMPLPAQAKVLRAIEDKEIVRLGGTRTIKIDVRIIAATNQDLGLLIKEKRFREDLFHRINVLKIQLPPLRERKEDIPILAEHFLKKACIDNNRPLKKLTNQVFHLLQNYDWPGNVRELEHLMNKVTILVDKNTIDISDMKKIMGIEDSIQELKRYKMDTVKSKFEREYIISVLNQTDWHISAAARILGINRSTLFRKMKRLGIKK
ncbi:hypothetical protein BXT86_05715 [candidate division WOR-3 bacterium 4484_100]|uniref:Sigma-54-dependent Fis family transcriptional regulator n=1 Tax=candidate division WOR-3 bacterium 4484_100 TaxID=1936077 RepID=A0A1V4QE12_UNCW3|nr:MAG: hypothetical protein BXT86_05715 [candidate division WOR-3 bacterium 4484_100]